MTEHVANEKPKTEAEILLSSPEFQELRDQKTKRYLDEGLSPYEAKKEAGLQALTVISAKAQIGDYQSSKNLSDLPLQEIPLIAKQAAEIIDPSRDK